MSDSHPQSLLLIGRDHQEYGRIETRLSASGRIACAISVGADPGSPAKRTKLSDEDLNEDALLAVESGARALLVIADAHYGSESSEHLVHELRRIARSIPATPEELQRCLERIEPGNANRLSASTLLIAVHDGADGSGFGISFGDSSLVAVGRSGARTLNPHNRTYLAPADHEPMPLDQGSRFTFRTESDELLLAFSDGINECHYRRPETSLQPRHLHELFLEVGEDPLRYAESLAARALAGVDGNPGGQDNISLIARSTAAI